MLHHLQGKDQNVSWFASLSPGASLERAPPPTMHPSFFAEAGVCPLNYAQTGCLTAWAPKYRRFSSLLAPSLLKISGSPLHTNIKIQYATNLYWFSTPCESSLHMDLKRANDTPWQVWWGKSTKDLQICKVSSYFPLVLIRFWKLEILCMNSDHCHL